MKNSKSVKYLSFYGEIEPNTFCEISDQQHGYAMKSNTNIGDSTASTSGVVRLDEIHFIGYQNTTLTLFAWNKDHGIMETLATQYLSGGTKWATLRGASWIDDTHIAVPMTTYNGSGQLEFGVEVIEYNETEKSLPVVASSVLKPSSIGFIYKGENGTCYYVHNQNSKFTRSEVLYNDDTKTLTLANEMIIESDSSVGELKTITEFAPGVWAVIYTGGSYSSELALLDVRDDTFSLLLRYSSIPKYADHLLILSPNALGVWATPSSDKSWGISVLKFDDDLTSANGTASITVYGNEANGLPTLSRNTGVKFSRNVNRNTYEFMSFNGKYKYDATNNKIKRTAVVPRNIWQTTWYGRPSLYDDDLGADIMGPISQGAQPYVFIDFKKDVKCIKESESLVHGLLITKATKDVPGTFLEWDTSVELSNYGIPERMEREIKDNAIDEIKQEVKNELNK